MRPIAEPSLHLRASGYGRSLPKRETSFSWYETAKLNADSAARFGFVLSMMFLASAAIYAVSLPAEPLPILSEIAAAADRAAFEAGFHLRDVAISGIKFTPEPALMEALELPYAESSLSYDTAKARNRLQSLGWIDSVEVRRVFPSRLEVRLIERKPLARWIEADGSIKVIDGDGHVLGLEENRFGALPLFAGEGAPIEAQAFLAAIATHEELKHRVERADMIAERFWLVELNDGVKLKLPRKLSKLIFDRLDPILANAKISAMPLDVIDLRLPQRTILQLRDPSVAKRDSAIALLTSPGKEAIEAHKGNAL